MAIVYPLTMPTVARPKRIELIARNVIGVSESPFTLQQQVVEYPGQGWAANVTLPGMRRSNAEQFVAFLLSLKGRFGTFLLSPFPCTPRGSAATSPGTPKVNGAGQTGSTLNFDGAPASAAGYLKAGDFIQIGSASSASLHKVLKDASSSALGQVSVEVWPSIVNAPADNSNVVVSSPAGLFRLASNETMWSVDEIAVYGISFSAVQATF